MKKMMLLALAAVSALLVVPTFASANPPLHISATGNFTVKGGASILERTSGGNSHGTSLTGTGTFTTTTSGTVDLTFHGVTSSLAGGNCDQGAGTPVGTVKTTKLPFHLVTLDGAHRGILITSVNGHFASFDCGPFNIGVNVNGNGILGTITSPNCSAPAQNTATLSFEKLIPGHQLHTQMTGTWGLDSTILGSKSPSSMQAEATITFPGTRTLTCT